MNNSRRRFLTLAALGGATAVGSLAYTRGLRYPPLQFEPDPVAGRGEAGSLSVRASGAMLQSVAPGTARARAFAPEPVFWLRCPQGASWSLELSNVHPEAVISAEPAGIEEQSEDLQRVVHGRGETRLHWRFPSRKRVRFTAIGDSGGGEELKWALKRSAELGAEFVLHLGDLNYVPGDLERAAAAFAAAPIPSYVAIGNHDFHDQDRSIHREFTRTIGPRNSLFRLGGVYFVNLDTAADSFPPGLGNRGKIIANLPDLEAAERAADCVVYTHRPLTDPRSKEDPSHGRGVNGPGEADWLRSQLLSRGIKTLLAGHLHIALEFDDEGLQTYISGQGLAHADLLVGEPVARILVGEAVPDQPVAFRWEPLNMPFEAHCNQGIWRDVLIETGKEEQVRRLRAVCG